MISLKNTAFPNVLLADIVVMSFGLIAITGVFGYIAYMRHKYEGLGYYTAVKTDGTEVFEKKKSRWEQ